MISPLRYPGGKAKLFDLFVQIIQVNNLHDRCYAEPYAGGAGLAIRLLAHGFVERVELNDIDPAIYSFWQAALRQTDEFCRRLWDTPITVEEWKRQKDIYRSADVSDHLSFGFSAYYLNRTSRSGIIEGSGPIGGYSQAGNWKIDARMNKAGQVKIVESLALLAPNIDLTNEDALDFLASRAASSTHFLYLDPPYYVKGRKLYKNFYKHADHAAIASLMASKRHGCWVISYDNAPEIRKLYDTFAATVYKLHYSAGPRTTGEEIIFSSDSVRIPDFSGFQLVA